ncbi:hypothetical protein E2562_010931 [Oryza meyeriana var. granulata]|uniref:non-specific serine/threonine protein kinase n=1 Tax=Oryza meyeriana var. granulata TaxID=110450 RepID=A0A6G1BWI2_9ORYZ|nr:hypothetical protein E2562_010931 [Oryza meyeriana var. granulata]
MPPSPLLLLVAALLAAAAAAQSAMLREDDVRCLRGVKKSLRDPDSRLLSWTFENLSSSAVCSYNGVSCWNPQEVRIIALSLSGFGLQGGIPSDLQFCSAATTLDLSWNALEGQIPPALCDWIPFVVKLDLSGNQLSGPLPRELANCRFLKSLKLSGNSFSGQIP